mmetsp:Transcript_13874/g.48324  ORF Transcript_13874/g.48324 Transcript_13874/m.48324 type:complete len:379 (+) Transcript_13874:4788-5924(+)
MCAHATLILERSRYDRLCMKTLLTTGSERGSHVLLLARPPPQQTSLSLSLDSQVRTAELELARGVERDAVRFCDTEEGPGGRHQILHVESVVAEDDTTVATRQRRVGEVEVAVLARTNGNNVVAALVERDDVLALAAPMQAAHVPHDLQHQVRRVDGEVDRELRLANGAKTRALGGNPLRQARAVHELGTRTRRVDQLVPRLVGVIETDVAHSRILRLDVSRHRRRRRGRIRVVLQHHDGAVATHGVCDGLDGSLFVSACTRCRRAVFVVGVVRVVGVQLKNSTASSGVRGVCAQTSEVCVVSIVASVVRRRPSGSRVRIGNLRGGLVGLSPLALASTPRATSCAAVAIIATISTSCRRCALGDLTSVRRGASVGHRL